MEPYRTFIESLQLIQKRAVESKTIKVKEIFHLLSGKGYAALFILLSLPFCLPIQIPGFSTPFGIILSFLGLRFAFAKKLWWPKWILEKEVSSQNVEALSNQAIRVMKKTEKILKPRLNFLTDNWFIHRLHGLLVFILAIFLSLPLPIPMTNLLSATPILFLGLGLLEDDGVFILLSYLFAIACMTFFAIMFLFVRNIF